MTTMERLAFDFEGYLLDPDDLVIATLNKLDCELLKYDLFTRRCFLDRKPDGSFRLNDLTQHQQKRAVRMRICEEDSLLSESLATPESRQIIARNLQETLLETRDLFTSILALPQNNSDEIDMVAQGCFNFVIQEAEIDIAKAGKDGFLREDLATKIARCQRIGLDHISLVQFESEQLGIVTPFGSLLEDFSSMLEDNDNWLVQLLDGASIEDLKKLSEAHAERTFGLLKKNLKLRIKLQKLENKIQSELN